ncbi:MAG: OPT/YSL family transporter [Planctomycetes bacterium]|nr:OPT/YSL family transporter [Planctomycetota bacterium]
MSQAPAPHGDLDLSHAKVRPPGAREFTLRGVLVAAVVAAMIGSAYPYVVLKLGFGPNIAVVSAFFGWLALAAMSRGVALRWESNLAQAAGTVAGQTAFMCTVLAAFDMLTMDPSAGVQLSLTRTQTFLWLTSAGVLGVLLAVPMRRHFIVDEKLPYADGLAAGETLIVLDSRGAHAQLAVRSMLAGLLSSALVTLGYMRGLIAEVQPIVVNAYSKVTGLGFSWGLLTIGSGMIIGLRICANMFLGMLLSWVIAPVLLVDHGVLAPGFTKRDLLLWVMWPATGMMVAGGLTALFLKWNILVRTFRQLSGASVDSEDLPLRWVAIGSLLAVVAIVLVQHLGLGMPVWEILLALLFTIPLMLVGLRVLGETNWGPISALSNLMQGVFGAISPGNIPTNMAASGLTGTVVATSEGLVQSYKTGDMIGSKPRYLAYVQLMAVPIGAAATAIVYPVLREVFGFEGDNALTSPISQKWVGFAKLLGQGLHTLHPSAIWALGSGVALGILFTVLEQRKSIRTWIPSPTGIGIGMLVPGAAVASMFLGSLIDWFFRRRDPRGVDRWSLPLASGFIAGEALIIVILSLLYAGGVLSPAAH